jgi:hypothetical protein
VLRNADIPSRWIIDGLALLGDPSLLPVVVDWLPPVVVVPAVVSPPVVVVPGGMRTYSAAVNELIETPHNG